MKEQKTQPRNNKIKTYPEELKYTGKFLNLEENEGITLLFMKW